MEAFAASSGPYAALHCCLNHLLTPIDWFTQVLSQPAGDTMYSISTRTNTVNRISSCLIVWCATFLRTELFAYGKSITCCWMRNQHLLSSWQNACSITQDNSAEYADMVWASRPYTKKCLAMTAEPDCLKSCKRSSRRPVKTRGIINHYGGHGQGFLQLERAALVQHFLHIHRHGRWSDGVTTALHD